MSSLTNAEKRKLEKLLGMNTGYVLNYSNRAFAELVVDSTGLNILDARYQHGSGSKANLLRKFWEVENDVVVGKLMADIVEDGFPADARLSVSDTALATECRKIIARLTQNDHVSRTASHGQLPHKEPPGQESLSRALLELKDDFARLTTESDRSKAGIALEKLLNRLFTLFGLEPRQPFRIVGEQIDGSFVLDGNVYLLESKWEKHPLPEADLLVFRGKIEGKSTFTRGVLIALNDVSIQARQAITQGKAPSFFVMNGYDLLRIFDGTLALPDFLRRRVRLLAEEGRMCVPFSELV